jgi:copper chaperone NosL
MSSISKISFFIGIILLLISCKVEPKEIGYGKDHCHLCDMTVVDKTHAAEYVTKKGKAYMFDAVECMVMKVNRETKEETLEFILVADYGNPGDLVNAKEAIYLISEKIKSPMGANLSAFSSNEKAIATQKEFGGNLYSWEELKTKLAQ